MAPYFREGMTGTQDLGFQRIVGVLGLDRQLWIANHGVPSEIGNALPNTSVVLLEPRIMMSNHDAGASCFAVLPSNSPGETIVRPYPRNLAGRRLTTISIGKTISVQALNVPPGDKLQTIIEVRDDFAGIEHPGFGRVMVWDKEQRKFKKAEGEFRTTFAGGVVLAPRIRSEAPGIVYILPLAKLVGANKAIESLKANL